MLELQHQPISEGVIAMIGVEICESVLGHGSGYVKGLGFGPNPASTSKFRQTFSQREVELEKKLFETQVLTEAQHKQLDTQHERIEHLETLLEQRDQQHQQQFEEILRHLISSQGSL